MWKRYTFLPAAATTKVVALLFHLFCTLLIRGRQEKDWSICIKCMLLKNPYSTPPLIFRQQMYNWPTRVETAQKIQNYTEDNLTYFDRIRVNLESWDANWGTFFKLFCIFCHVKIICQNVASEFASIFHPKTCLQQLCTIYHLLSKLFSEQERHAKSHGNWIYKKS